jgi:signal transduction histidine kinase
MISSKIKIDHFILKASILFFLLVFLAASYSIWPWRSWQIGQGLYQSFPILSSLYALALWEAANNVFGIFFLIPIIYSILTFPQRSIWGVGLLIITGITPIALGWFLGIQQHLKNTYFFLLPIFLIVVINLELELRRRDRSIMIQRETEKRLYVSQVIEAQEKERKRISQEIHDDTIQTLIAISKYAEVIESGDSDISEKQKYGAVIRSTVTETVENLRRMVLELRPRLLDELGLIPALNWLINTLNSQNATHYMLVVEGNERKLNFSIEMSVFRIIQEALNNVKKHANCGEAIVTIQFYGDNIKITIEDKGQGFDPDLVHKQTAINGKMGLFGMRERVESIGGTFLINSIYGKGTVISIQLKC